MTNNNTNTTNNTINTNINDFFARQARKEEEATRAWIEDCINTFGAAMIKSKLEDILRHLSEINQAVADVAAEEAKEFPESIIEKIIEIANEQQIKDALKIIPTSKYFYKKVKIDGTWKLVPKKFSDATNNVFDEVCKATGVGVVGKRYGKYSAAGNITCPDFAKYIIQASGDNPDVLTDIINILKATSWDRGYGICVPKMEIIYHTLILHWDRRNEVKDELIKLLKNYDYQSLKVTANQDDRYRNHLKHTEKMMMFVEDAVCATIGAKPKFVGKVKEDAEDTAA